MARRFKQGWPSSSWPSSSSTGPSNGARERESLRSATGHSVTQRPCLCSSSISIPNIYFIFSCGGLQTTPPPDLKPGGQAQTKRSAGGAVDCQHQTSYGVRHGGIRNTAPGLPQSPFSSLDMTDVHSHLANTHQLRCTPTLIPPEKEGVPIVRISV